MVEPPPQLRVRSGLDGLVLELSGRPRSLLADLRKPANQTFGWILMIVFSLFAMTGSVVGAVLAFATVAVFMGARFVDSEAGAWKSRVVLTPTHLELTRDGERQRVPWVEVGLVTVTGGSAAVVHVQRSKGDQLFIPMELEPQEHAVWVALTIDERAMEARDKHGTRSDVPQSIRRLRT